MAADPKTQWSLLGEQASDFINSGFRDRFGESIGSVNNLELEEILMEE